MLSPFHHAPLYYIPEEVPPVIPHEFRLVFPRQQHCYLPIAQHNHMRRFAFQRRNAIIADTIRPGYEQITSHCRSIRKLVDCYDQGILGCLKNDYALSQIKHRWVGDSTVW